MRFNHRLFTIGSALLLSFCLARAGRSRSPVLATEADAASLRARVERTIRDTQSDADRIIQAVLNGSAHHQAWNRLAEFTDTIGHRLSGTDSFVQGVEWIQQRMNAEGLDNVHQEMVQVPLWLRGEESVTLLEPRVANLNMLGLGNSVAGNITAEVLVVKSFDELKQQAAAGNTSGKIILFNHQCDWKSRPTDCYSDTIDYREEGPSAASRVGAVATLVKSLAAFSINSPHTGTTDYDDDVVQIPAAAITLEDAEMMQRMQDRGQRVVVNLLMNAKSYGNVSQPNLVAEIVGSEFPEEVVLVSGHLDSWDPPTGSTGAMDDGGGAFISWQVLTLLRSLGITPRRTIRFVGWACEEFGGIGAQQYYDLHKGNISNMDFVMESDAGVFRAYGIRFSGSAAAQAIVQQLIASLLTPINATTLVVGGGGEDIDPWQENGVPGASLANHNERYFWFHHSGGDTMSVLDPDEVDSATITWAVTALAVANLDDLLPRNSHATPRHVLEVLRQPLPPSSAAEPALL